MSYPYRGAAFTSLILMGSALMASNALAQQERPCETCEASDPANRSAKAIGMPMQMPRGPAGPERPDCCPPVIANKAYLGTSFAFHQLPGENSNQHYGLSYTPNAAFNAQMTLWAPYAASALAVPGWTPQAVVMAAEMRTDAPSTIAVNYSTHPAWNNWPPTIGISPLVRRCARPSISARGGPIPQHGMTITNSMIRHPAGPHRPISTWYPMAAAT